MSPGPAVWKHRRSSPIGQRVFFHWFLLLSLPNQALTEKIRRISLEKSCESSLHCRSYQEIQDIASCKASRLASQLPVDKDVYYLMTDFKPRGVNEIAKFIYAIINNRVPVQPIYNGDIEFVKSMISIFLKPKLLQDLRACSCGQEKFFGCEMSFRRLRSEMFNIFRKLFSFW